MAVIKNKKEFVQSVGIIIATDNGIIDEMFPSTRLHVTQEIEYDMAIAEGVTKEYNSFANTARVTKKDGKDVVKLSPVNLNDSISKETIDADKIKFGQNEYGEGIIDAEMESALNGVGKLRLDHLATRKSLVYEALTTHRIAKGYESENGKQDIVFPIPGANKIVFDGTTAGQKYWSANDATPLDNIVEAYNKMNVKPSAVIMNDATYSNFYESDQVLTVDNTTAGTKKNFTVNENIDPTSMFFTAGRIMYKGIILDVKVERQRKSDNTPFMPNGYVVLASPIGEMHYGGIPIAETGGVRRIAAEWDAEEIMTSNPPQHNIVVRTAPLPVLKNGEAYYSMKVEA